MTRNQPAPRRRFGTSVALYLGVCLTACDDDSGAANVAVQMPDEGRTGTDGTLGAASSRELSAGERQPGASPSVDLMSAEPLTESTAALSTSGETSRTAPNDQRSSAEDPTTTLTASADATADAAPQAPVVGRCTSPISVTCGARLRHDTRVNGQPSEFFGYACTARALGGPETIYQLEGAEGCDVVVRLTALETELYVISTPKCEPFVEQTCSSPDPDNLHVERLLFTASATEHALLSVDSYDDGAGAYTLEVDCTCDLTLDTSTN